MRHHFGEDPKVLLQAFDRVCPTLQQLRCLLAVALHEQSVGRLVLGTD
jgi:hypothetical protein